MAYFSNATEGDIYHAQWCARCVNHDRESGCPIWGAHFMHQHEKAARPVLDMLIPPHQDGRIGECKFFREDRKAWAVGDLFEEGAA